MTNLYADLTDEADPQPPVEIPHQELSPDALRGVIESFVLREGTEYGWRDYSLDEKVAHVMRQLERKEARIMFDPNTETVQIAVVENHKSKSEFQQTIADD
jgi:uncharacterized protein YheU (UPF0270 family)